METPNSRNAIGKHYIIGMVLAAAVGSIGDLIPILQRLKTEDTTPEHPSSGFEQWGEGYVSDKTYTAESDGFVVAYGSDPNGYNEAGVARTGSGLIKAGAPQEVLRTMTRFGPGYQGAMLAIPKGYSWKVQRNPNNGKVTVRWLPVKPS